MRRKVRIVAIGIMAVTAIAAAGLTGVYYATRQVRPFYQQALQVEPVVLERGSHELENRATALYSEVKQVGRWQALFTAEQINGWLATQLNQPGNKDLPTGIRDPRVAIERDTLTLGFRMMSGGIETVVSVDASVALTDNGDVAVRLISVHAGALPLPVMQLADRLAEACRKLQAPVRWTRQNSQPVALIEVGSRDDIYVDAIQLDEGQLFVAGHTERKQEMPGFAGLSVDERHEKRSQKAVREASAEVEIARKGGGAEGKLQNAN